MSRLLIVLLLLLLKVNVFAGEPVVIGVTSKALGEGKYVLQANVKLEPGWHLYAENDAGSGLAAFQFFCSDERVQLLGPMSTNSKTILFRDPLFERKAYQVYTGELLLTQQIKVQGEVPASIAVSLHGFVSNNYEFLPVEMEKEVALGGGVETAMGTSIKLNRLDVQHPLTACGTQAQTAGKGLLSLFLLGLLGGFIALLTPCVFPMIPVTVSYFISKSGDRKTGVRNAITYAFFIFFIYLIFSIPFHLTGNISPELFNSIATNTVVNILFFMIFLVFALSFFGLFELSLPAALLTQSDSKSGLGSAGGIFFMALTLAVVSFSCTGPILGSLLVGSLSTQAGAWQLTAGMVGFGFALALPFGVFAMFPQLLKSMPKSGGWMQQVKVILAFVELGLALKFLSNADLVGHWGLLKREVFVGLWMLLSLCLGLYLSGVFEPRKKRALMYVVPAKKTFSWRYVGAGVAFCFALYLVPGIFASGKYFPTLISGFAPPNHYSIYTSRNTKDGEVSPKVVNDFDKAVALSKLEGKPILIDFTGWACVNCRKMEELVWTQSGIKSLLDQDYILLSLYVDDRQKLPAAKQFTYRTQRGIKKEVKTVGDQWSLFQSENFGQVTQPLYVIISAEGSLLNAPIGYTSDGSKYEAWLKCGLNSYAVQKNVARL